MTTKKILTRYVIRDMDLTSSDSEMPAYAIPKAKDLPENERPREKLIAHGPETLKSSELLAAMLMTGTRKEEVMSMSERIFREYGEKAIAFQKNPTSLARDLEIPESKACQIVAAFELGRRFFQKDGGENVTIRTARQAFEYLRSMSDLPKEQLRGLYLNSHFRIIHDEVISVGSLTANIVHPREVFRPAIKSNAAAVLIAHNHPSGSSRPTRADIDITCQLEEAGRILGIELIDHIVIGRHGFSSISPENRAASGKSVPEV